ncbi:MAG: cation-transporting P-type ATPase, partial [Protaetiibacter sp.]
MSDATTARSWHALAAQDAVAALDSDADEGLSAAVAAERLAEHGPNLIAASPQPSVWQLGANQLVDPMNIMLVAVSVVSIVIGQLSVGVLVGALVVLNVVLGTRQELKAQASVSALAELQVPRARVTRGGTLLEIPASELVPGDIVSLEAGDLVPADGRLLRTATLETQEAALTGESAPIAKDAAPLEGEDVALGDRINLAF